MGASRWQRAVPTPPATLPPDDLLEREKGLTVSGFQAAQVIAQREIARTLRVIDAGRHSDDYIAGALDMAIVLQVALLCDINPALAEAIDGCELL
jgi:hypothetical protein